MKNLSAHQPLFLPLPVFALFVLAFVVVRLAFGQRDFEFCVAALPVHRQRHDRIAFLLGGAY